MSVADPFHYDLPAFEIVVARRWDHVLVRPDGELDIATVEPLRAKVLELAAGGCARLVLDLSRLRFVDSCQLHLLAELELAAALDGFDFAVRVGEGTPARRLLALTGLEQRFATA